MQNVRRETSRTFRNKKRECLKGKINGLETNNKNKEAYHSVKKEVLYTIFCLNLVYLRS
jgi:hypothetical protein